jgi:hypothetical protein
VARHDPQAGTSRLLRPAGNWTPDGFGWGYEGDGPTELAHALLADATGSPPLARRHAPGYAAALTPRLPAGQPWVLPVAEVRAWAAAAEAPQPAPTMELGL